MWNLGGGMSAQTRASRSSGSSTRATVPSRQGFLSEYRSLDVTVLFADSQAAGNNGSRSLQTISKSARVGSPVACETAAA